MIRAALLAWLAMLPLAVANGALRDLTYGRRLPEPVANRISCLTASLAFLLFALAWGRLHPLEGLGQALAVGLLWVGLTVAFEFLAGRFLSKRSWASLAAEYDLAAGRLWLLVLATLGLSPALSWLMRQ